MLTHMGFDFLVRRHSSQFTKSWNRVCHLTIMVKDVNKKTCQRYNQGDLLSGYDHFTSIVYILNDCEPVFVTERSVIVSRQVNIFCFLSSTS